MLKVYKSIPLPPPSDGSLPPVHQTFVAIPSIVRAFTYAVEALTQVIPVTDKFCPIAKSVLIPAVDIIFKVLVVPPKTVEEN